MAVYIPLKPTQATGCHRAQRHQGGAGSPRVRPWQLRERGARLRPWRAAADTAGMAGLCSSGGGGTSGQRHIPGPQEEQPPSLARGTPRAPSTAAAPPPEPPNHTCAPWTQHVHGGCPGATRRLAEWAQGAKWPTPPQDPGQHVKNKQPPKTHTKEKQQQTSAGVSGLETDRGGGSAVYLSFSCGEFVPSSSSSFSSFMPFSLCRAKSSNTMSSSLRERERGRKTHPDSHR